MKSGQQKQKLKKTKNKANRNNIWFIQYNNCNQLFVKMRGNERNMMKKKKIINI